MKIILFNISRVIVKQNVLRFVYVYVGDIRKAKRVGKLKIKKMFNKFTLTDKLLFISAILSLVYSEILFFNDNPDQAIFIGLWVPSILAFGIYLKLINNNKND